MARFGYRARAVSKEGFHARERSVPEPGAPRYPVSLGFELEAIDAPIIVAGMYDMTFTAAIECTQLPTVARQPTYRAQGYPNGAWPVLRVGLQYRADL